MAISDSLIEADIEIRGYIDQFGIEYYGALGPEIYQTLAAMEALRIKLDSLGQANEEKTNG